MDGDTRRQIEELGAIRSECLREVEILCRGRAASIEDRLLGRTLPPWPDAERERMIERVRAFGAVAELLSSLCEAS